MPSFSKCSSLIVCQIKQSFGVLYSLQVMHDLLWTGTFWPFTSETRDRKMLSLITAVIFPPEKVGKTTAQLEHLKHRKGVKTSQCHQIMIWPYVLSLKTTLSFVKWKKWSFNSTPPPSIEDLPCLESPSHSNWPHATWSQRLQPERLLAGIQITKITEITCLLLKG